MRYKVYATMSVELETEIEADSLEEAWEKARETDGAEFKEIDGSGAWNVFDVVGKQDT
jgi:hypothetical protein